MLNWLLAAALAVSPSAPQRIDANSFTPPDELYEVNRSSTLLNSCHPLPMKAVFDELQTNLVSNGGRMAARIQAYYDGPAFVLLVLSAANNDGKLEASERVYVSDRSYCLRRFIHFSDEAKRVAEGGKPDLPAGSSDLTNTILYFSGTEISSNPNTFGRGVWMINFFNTRDGKPKGKRCYRTTMFEAIESLKRQAKTYPRSGHFYELMNDGGHVVLRVLISPPKEMATATYFVETEALCEANWRRYFARPFWGHIATEAYEVTGKGVVLPVDVRALQIPWL